MRTQFSAEETVWLSDTAVRKFFRMHFADALKQAVDFDLNAHGFGGHKGQAKVIEEVLKLSDAEWNEALRMRGERGKIALESCSLTAADQTSALELAQALSCKVTKAIEQQEELIKKQHELTEQNQQLKQHNAKTDLQLTSLKSQFSLVKHEAHMDTEMLKTRMECTDATLATAVKNYSRSMKAVPTLAMQQDQCNVGHQELKAENKKLRESNSDLRCQLLKTLSKNEEMSNLFHARVQNYIRLEMPRTVAKLVAEEFAACMNNQVNAQKINAEDRHTFVVKAILSNYIPDAALSHKYIAKKVKELAQAKYGPEVKMTASEVAYVMATDKHKELLKKTAKEQGITAIQWSWDDSSTLGTSV